MVIAKLVLPGLVLATLPAGAWADCGAPSTQSEMTQAAKTESRLKEIKALQECEEGDMSCPAHK